MENISKKLERLKKILQDYNKIAIAFSGGVDSTFLLCFAQKILGSENVLAITAKAPNFAPDEINFATEYAKALSVPHTLVNIDMDKPINSISSNYDIRSLFISNPKDRCYYCKFAIFSQMKKQLENFSMISIIDSSSKSKEEFEHIDSQENSSIFFANNSDVTFADLVDNDYVLCDGTNFDDKDDYRPGLRALAELDIKSPLAMAELTKLEIRRASNDLNIPIWDKPAFACLASRIPYGEPITAEKLSAIYTLESHIKQAGFSQVRVRCHSVGAVLLARIELLPEDIPRFARDRMFCEQINNLARSVGFSYATLDVAGYKMGNLNSLS